MQCDHCHWSQENTCGLCVYWCMQLLLQRLARALEHRLIMQGVCILSLCVCVRMLGCYWGISWLSRHSPECETVYLGGGGVVLWAWKAWCGESDAEEQSSLCAYSPHVLALLLYSLADAFSNPTLQKEVGGGGQGYLCLQVGGCELAENTCS